MKSKTGVLLGRLMRNIMRSCGPHLFPMRLLSLDGFPFQCRYPRLARGSWDTRAVYAGADMAGGHSWIDSEVDGRGDSLLVPAGFPAVYQFSLCPHRNHA